MLITSYLVHIPFVHDHFTKLPVCRSETPTFMFSPKCVLNDPLGVAGTLACGAGNCQWHEYIPLYGDCPDPGCNSCLQVTDCLGLVFVYSVLQIIRRLNRVSVAPTQCHTFCWCVNPRITAFAAIECYWKCEGWPHLCWNRRSSLVKVLCQPSAAPKRPKHHCHVIDKFACSLLACLQHRGGRLEHVLERTWKLDYLTYRLEALWNDHAQTEVNEHQI